jgi:lysophospholipase L1-like esterase
VKLHRVLVVAAAAALAIVGCGSAHAPPSEGSEAPVPIGAGTQPSSPAAPSTGPGGEADAGRGGGAVTDGAADGDGGKPVALAPYHLEGRVDRRDPDGPRFGWPGSRLRARFTGTGLSLVLADRGTSHYDVSIDGASTGVLIVTGSARPYEVAAGLAPGVHDVVVTKRTETFLGVTQLQGIVPAPGGAIVPSPVWTGVRMEIIGDSISCGYGVLGTDAFCPFSADTEAETEAWGALAARELSAAHTTIAWSGLGLYRNYDGVTTDTMPLLYGRAIGDDPESTWDHSFVPDVVVVALGTNDFAGGKGDPGSVFETTYVAFLEELRSIHPKAHLAVATSPMLSGNNRAKLLEYATAAVAARVNAGDANVSLVDLDEQRELDGYGCNHHPNVVTQRKMAAKLVAHLRARLGL